MEGVVQEVRFRPHHDHARFETTDIIEVKFQPGRFNVPLIPHRGFPFDGPHRETREEYGYRLRRAAAEVGRAAENAVIRHLKDMGHLVR